MVESPIELVLSRLEKVKKTGKGYIALCPAHPDKSPSLSLKEGSDGRVLIHCFAGCTADQVVNEIGLQMSDLFFRNNDSSRTYVRSPIPISNIREAANFELQILYVVTADRLKGKPISDVDQAREALAINRLNSVKEYL
jgi:hypothetical protein